MVNALRRLVFARRCLAGALFALGVVLAGPLEATAPGSGGPCQGKTGVKRRDRFDFRAGVDVRRFHMFSGRSITTLTGDAGKDGRRLEEVRLRAYKDALEQLKMLRGVSYSNAREKYADALTRFVTAADQSVLGRDVRPLRESESEDYDKCLYVYEVVLGVRLETRLESLEPSLEDAVEDFLKQFPASSDSLDISISDLFRHLRSDPRFSAAVDRVWEDQRLRDAFDYKDDDTQAFLTAVKERSVRISHYEKGQYRPSTVLAAIILRAVRPRVLGMLERYKSVGVTCVGYADRLPIRSGLAYEGEARLATGGLPQAYGTRSGRSLRPVLANNLELSFARAHEALVVLATGLPQSARLTLRYHGRGEVAGPQQDDPFSRRVVFEIRGVDAYQ